MNIIHPLIIALVLQLIFPCSIFAQISATTIAVVPVHDGVSDEYSNELAEMFSKALESEELYVVSREKTSKVLDYYGRGGVAEGIDISAEELLIQAKEQYYNFNYEEALALSEKTISALETEPLNISEHGLLLRDAYVTAGIIERSKKGRDDFAKEYFKKSVSLDPQYELDAKGFPPSTISLFNSAKGEILSAPLGAVKVETDPSVAEVYLNGILKGVTPLTISGLPEGAYSVAIKTNKYKKVERTANISSVGTSVLKEKLLWVAEGKAGKTVLSPADEARERIDEGVRIAEIIRTDKVIMIDADEELNGNGEITVRMIDREFRAGHNPVIIRYKSNKEFLVENLAETAEILTKQSRVAILNNPTKHVDPDGIGDPILLGKRRRELATIPAFWAVVGGALAATAGGVTAAMVAGGGGDTPATGSVNVQFK